MAELFKDPPVAAFRRARNLKDIVVRAELDNPMVALKLVPMPGAFCVSTALTRTNLLAPLRVAPTKYWVTCLATKTTVCISSVLGLAQNNMLGKRVTSAEE
jgi:hypothetical protein